MTRLLAILCFALGTPTLAAELLVIATIAATNGRANALPLVLWIIVSLALLWLGAFFWLIANRPQPTDRSEFDHDWPLIDNWDRRYL